jgi:predicted extracellular nuclease
VVVLGDLNSFYDSPPLDAVREAGLRHVYEFSEPERPYTYIFQGESETLDHILVTPSLYELLVRVEALHINADYPPPVPGDPSARRVSDHDPLVAVFSFAP